MVLLASFMYRFLFLANILLVILLFIYVNTFLVNEQQKTEFKLVTPCEVSGDINPNNEYQYNSPEWLDKKQKIDNIVNYLRNGNIIEASNYGGDKHIVIFEGLMFEYGNIDATGDIRSLLKGVDKSKLYGVCSEIPGIICAIHKEGNFLQYSESIRPLDEQIKGHGLPTYLCQVFSLCFFFKKIQAFASFNSSTGTPLIIYKEMLKRQAVFQCFIYRKKFVLDE